MPVQKTCLMTDLGGVCVWGGGGGRGEHRLPEEAIEGSELGQ